MREIAWLLPLLACALPVSAHNWLSGQDSPVHDARRLTPVSGQRVVLENDDVLVAFDSVSGALVEFDYKRTGWHIQRSPELAESFRIFAPGKDRSYSPLLGARNRVESITKSADGRALTIIWSGLQSEYYGKLAIRLTARVTLHGSDVSFQMNVRNDSQNEVASIDWPIIGAFEKPTSAQTIRHVTFAYGGGASHPVYPEFQNDHGYYGTNYPIQMGDNQGVVRYDLMLSEGEGLYIGNHDTACQEITRWTLELKPGYEDSFDSRVSVESSISGDPVRIVGSVEHFPFVPPGHSFPLARVVLSPFRGGWQHGADVYRRWRATWYHAPVAPAWTRGVHSWEQIQINSSEDDLRTAYRDLPKRAEQAAENGINAIQLVGWNNGGQDRGNPSHDTDPRLGTHEELKDAIAKIEKLGVHVVLFNKYTWADTTDVNYDSELSQHMAKDPNGRTYIYHGYEYQTPEQLADINTRRLAVACTPDEYWLKLAEREFQKSIDLGASGILYDEVGWHGGAYYCFRRNANGDLSAQSLFAGDQALAAGFRALVRKTVGEKRFLMAGEDPYDLEQRYYSESYFRILPGHIPLERYDDPYLNIMIALTGFDDREMANEALRYRYVMSYEPFNFKGNLSDFPLTLAYGKKIDALRNRYRSYLWDGEFRDTLGASVTVAGTPYPDYSVFRRRDGKRAVVIVNATAVPVMASVSLDSGMSGSLAWVSPEDPVPHPYHDSVKIPFRGVVVLMQRN